jgi:hypothetical protein
MKLLLKRSVSNSDKHGKEKSNKVFSILLLDTSKY